MISRVQGRRRTALETPKRNLFRFQLKARLRRKKRMMEDKDRKKWNFTVLALSGKKRSQPKVSIQRRKRK
jgi:hypothetical protein